MRTMRTCMWNGQAAKLHHHSTSVRTLFPLSRTLMAGFPPSLAKCNSMQCALRPDLPTSHPCSHTAPRVLRPMPWYCGLVSHTRCDREGTPSPCLHTLCARHRRSCNTHAMHVPRAHHVPHGPGLPWHTLPRPHELHLATHSYLPLAFSSSSLKQLSHSRRRSPPHPISLSYPFIDDGVTHTLTAVRRARGGAPPCLPQPVSCQLSPQRAGGADGEQLGWWWVGQSTPPTDDEPRSSGCSTPQRLGWSRMTRRGHRTSPGAIGHPWQRAGRPGSCPACARPWLTPPVVAARHEARPLATNLSRPLATNLLATALAEKPLWVRSPARPPERTAAESCGGFWWA